MIAAQYNNMGAVDGRPCRLQVGEVLCLSKIKLTGYHQETSSDWKPIALRPIFLSSTIIASIGLTAVLHVLLLKSQRNNGIAFAASTDKFSTLATFGYLYLPTILAVIYGFLWSWIDLDVRRMEPYFQLAKRGGASGAQSVLLCYPVDFLASVPIKAWKFR
jgi:hypothetical protein